MLTRHLDRLRRKPPMRIGAAVLLIAGLVAAAAGMATPAAAQNYPWCAHYDKGDGEMNCGFVSFAQCLADVSGLGGFCQENNTYTPPTAARPAHRAAHRAAHRHGRKSS